ncbi:MAG: hypothetical protein IPM92_10315 [Saprospiraceae bacterium]|nr:hypothetical protein [Saprospiraceae bacterium]
MNTSFSLNRIAWLTKKEFYESFLPFFRIMGIVLAGILVLTSVVAYFENGKIGTVSLEGFFAVFGFIYIVNSFEELKKLPTRADYLNLPATAFEKVFTKWMFGNILFWIGSIILFYLFYMSHQLIVEVFMNKPTNTYSLFTRENLQGLHFIIIVFSVFFFGAAMFNTGSWYKVILWTIVSALAYMLVVALFAYILFPEFRDGIHGVDVDYNVPIDLILEDFWMFKLGKFFLQYLAAPFFWYMTYLKIKEKEV